MIKTRTVLIYVMIAIILFISGCGNNIPGDTEEYNTETTMITVIDSFGREVSVPEEVNRIAALYSFAGYAVCVLSGGSNLVAVSGGLQRDVLLRELIPEIADTAVPRTSGTINIEELLRINPDLVIIRGDTAADDKELDKLDKSGLPYIIVEYSTVKEQQEAISIIGKAIGRSEEAKVFNDYYNNILNKVEEAVKSIPPEERTRVYHSENQATRTIHRTSLAADWSKAAGVINVSINEELNLVNNDYYASMEQILLWDPEVIIANENSAMAYILGNPQWSGIQAVQSERVYKLPQGISRWGHPGSVETPLAVLWTAKTVYPEKFEHVDMEDEVEFFYQSFFNYHLTGDMIQKILGGEGLRESK